tara:strand:- start:27 stop:326 length:300 start_codon:yes stop_codon:yes gene_type:complete
MTEKQQEDFANKVAEIVIKAMEKRQEEFDIELAKSFEDKNITFATWPPPGDNNLLSEKERLVATLEQLERDLSNAILNEDYNGADDISKNIEILLNKLR